MALRLYCIISIALASLLVSAATAQDPAIESTPTTSPVPIAPSALPRQDSIAEIRYLLQKGTYQIYTAPAEALHNLQYALMLAQQIRHRESILTIWCALGRLALHQQKNRDALKYYLQAYRLGRSHAQAPHQVGEALLGLGQTQLAQRHYEEALNWFERAAALAEQHTLQVLLAQAWQGQAQAYRQIQKPTQAMRWLHKALRQAERDTTPLAQRTRISVLCEFGSLMQQTRNIYDALPYYRDAIKLAKQYSTDRAEIAYPANQLAKYYLSQKDLTAAYEWADLAKTTAQATHQSEELLWAYQTLARIAEQQGQYQQALQHYQAYSTLRDTLQRQSEMRHFAEIQQNFAAERRRIAQGLQQKERIIQQEEAQIRMLTRYGGWFLLLVVLAASILLYRSNLRRRRANSLLRQRNAEVVRQKKEIQRQHDDIEHQHAELLLKNNEIATQNQAYAELLQQLHTNNIRLTDSVRYAERMQRAILPREHSFRAHFADHFVVFKPKDLVSGDFYWFSEILNKVFVAVVDCTGHGIPGAFMSMIGNTLLNEIVNQEGYIVPGEILEHLHLGVRLGLKQQDGQNMDGMELTLCCFERINDQEVRMQFSGAKSGIFYISEGKLCELRGERKTIGGWQREEERERLFETKEVILRKGDCVYFYSDGYPDASNHLRKKLGYRRFREILAAHHHLKMKEQGAALLTALYEHQGQNEQRDDITLLGLRL